MDVHLANLSANLQLVADLGYGDVALALPQGDALVITADARPVTAVTAVPGSRVGAALSRDDDVEAYEAFESGRTVGEGRRRSTRGIAFSTTAYPVRPGDGPTAVLVRHVSTSVQEAPGRMERESMAIAAELIGMLQDGPLTHVDGADPFVTTRRAGDGLLRIGSDGRVAYASPNAVNIVRAAGAEEPIVQAAASSLPGSAIAITPALRSGACLDTEVESGGRVLNYRTIGVAQGAAVLVEDVTAARRHEQELKVKEATIREVHHRVKNNLQTIASLLRIQARRTDNREAGHALSEAVERIGSMAVVHEMLAATADENVDFTEAARTVVDMVRQSVAGPDTDLTVEVEGGEAVVPASAATSLALVVAELVHNAIEHGLAGRDAGAVTVTVRERGDELFIAVRDDGMGLPDDFDLDDSANLGLAIVRTVVQDDLGGKLTFGGGRGTTVTIRVTVVEGG